MRRSPASIWASFIDLGGADIEDDTKKRQCGRGTPTYPNRSSFSGRGKKKVFYTKGKGGLPSEGKRRKKKIGPEIIPRKD